MRKLSQASVVVGLLLAAHLALADTVVHLKNGDVASGTPVEITRGDHVTLKLATGEVRTYPWADIESVTDDAGTPAPVVVAPAAAAAPAGVLVHLVANDSHAMLAASSGYGEGGNAQVSIQIEEYKSFCMVPCDKAVPPGVYRIVGKDLASTDDFTLADGARSVQLDATMHGRARSGWGRMLTVAGIAFVGSGALLFAVPSLAPSLGGDNKTMFYGAGGAMVAAGVGLLIGGIYLLTTASSTVDVKTAQSAVGSFLTHGMQVSF